MRDGQWKRRTSRSSRTARRKARRRLQGGGLPPGYGLRPYLRGAGFDTGAIGWSGYVVGVRRDIGIQVPCSLAAARTGVAAGCTTPAVFNLRPSFQTARWLVPVYGVLGLALALQMRGIVETLKLSYSFFAAGMILPILFGFFRKLWLPLGDAVAARLAGGSPIPA